MLNQAKGQKILIISPAWLGDIIMSQSLLSTLKHLDPSCHITVYAPAYAHPILQRMSQVDEILNNPFAHGALHLKERYQEGKKLQEMGFDVAYVLPNSFKSALPAFFAKIPERIGWQGEMRYGVLNFRRQEKKSFPRMVERYVSLAYIHDQKVTSESNLPSFAYPQLQTVPPTPELLERLQLSLERPLLTLGCGANYGPAKLWPVEYFAEVSNYFIREHQGAVLALGTTKDQETVNKIKEGIATANQAYFYDICGKTNLTEALDLVACSRIAVCNDSGMMHTVAACNVPQVCIFGSTSTSYTPPLSNKAVCLESKEECHPCFKRECKFNTYQCLKGLTPDMVIKHLEQLLQHHPKPSAQSAPASVSASALGSVSDTTTAPNTTTAPASAPDTTSAAAADTKAGSAEKSANASSTATTVHQSTVAP